MKAIQIQLSPTKTQVKLLKTQIEEHRCLYNRCLELKIIAYKTDKTNLSAFDLIKSEIKNFPRIVSNYSSMQQTIRRLGKTYDSFFKKHNDGQGFPRFKSVDRFNTVEYGKYGDGNKIKNNYLYLQNIGLIKCLWFGDIDQSVIRCISVTRRADKFFVNITIESSTTAHVPTTKQIGIDFGLKTFVTTSDGDKFESPKFHKKSLKEEAKLHRRIHKSPKKSKLRQKHKKSLVKLQRKIKNRRKDFNHKLSRKLINENDFIAMEDINLKSLVSDIQNINRTYQDVAIGQFKNFLTYKAENSGKVLVKVNPSYTSQECYNCRKLTPKTLAEREHICTCGYSECRDINAAKNILRRGLASLG